jgi:nucleoside-diphosphate kinase
MSVTFAMVKPDAVAAGNIAQILAWAERDDFEVAEMRLLRATCDQAAELYREHAGKPFYDDLCAHACSGPCVALVLEREDAVQRWRRRVTGIRRLYAHPEVKYRNAVHGSDSDEAAEREIELFFGGGCRQSEED